jgi:hypothetical protein
MAVFCVRVHRQLLARTFRTDITDIYYTQVCAVLSCDRGSWLETPRRRAYGRAYVLTCVGNCSKW